MSNPIYEIPVTPPQPPRVTEPAADAEAEPPTATPAPYKSIYDLPGDELPAYPQRPETPLPASTAPAYTSIYDLPTDVLPAYSQATSPYVIPVEPPTRALPT